MKRSLALAFAVLVAGVAALMAAMSPPASAAPGDTMFRFEGRGFGHGVGMSQFGARGAALRGLDARAILAHYYRGAVLETRPARQVRVRIAEDRLAAAVGSTQPFTVQVVGTPETIPFAADRPFRVSVDRHRVRIRNPAGTYRVTADATVSLTPAPGAFIAVDGRRFRGRIELVPVGGSRLDVVNHVGLEEYLQGVIPGEVPASWGDDTPEALRAQAIAARSYTLASLRPGRHFDLHADVRSQVYGGLDAEDPRTNAAVQATRGQVLTYGGEVITAFYFSTSGGRTENVENVFGGEPRPYLVSVPDPYDFPSPYHLRWPDPVTVSGSRLAELFGLSAPVRGVEITRRGASPRVLEARLVTESGGVLTVTGADLRRELGLRDTWFQVVRVRPTRPPRSGDEVTLSVRQLRINQRIAQAAVRRVNALGAIMAGEPAPQPRPGGGGDEITLSRRQLLINQRIAQAAVRRVNALTALVNGEPAPQPAADGEAGRVTLSARQLLINQRISQAALRRVAALQERVGVAG